jgi:hypothetical protein
LEQPTINIRPDLKLWNRKWKIIAKNPKALFLTGSTYTDTLRMIVQDAGGLADTQDVVIKATY